MAKKGMMRKKLNDEENLGDSKEEIKVSELVSLNKESEELSLSEKKSNELVKLEDTEKKASEKQERGAKILLFVILGIVAFLFIFGLVIGSFLNVLAFRYDPDQPFFGWKRWGGRTGIGPWS